MQGITSDRAGNIWIVEHGQRGGDELNLIIAGKDYGWPATSLGTRFNRLPLPNTTEYGRHNAAFEPPVYAWLAELWRRMEGPTTLQRWLNVEALGHSKHCISLSKIRI